MTQTEAKLAALNRISRERSLTDAELDTYFTLLHRQRQYARDRLRYANDPSYRAQRYGVTGTRRDVALSKVRDEQGRFV